MSPRTDPTRQPRPALARLCGRQRTTPADAGFSMVEVLVSVAIIAALVVAVLPHIVGSIRGNDAATRNTQAKSIAQSELELMRNLPYNVSPDAGDYIDVFDRYFRNRTAPGAAPTCTDADGRFRAPTGATRGYVAPTGGRCEWEPTGAMYRQIRTATDNPDLDGWVVVINTQFLSNATPPVPVTPPSAYDTQDDASDTPPATQVGVTVSVFPEDGTVANPVSTHTQIAKTTEADARIEAALDQTALSFGTTSPLGFPVTMHAGRVDASGRLTSASTAQAVLSSIGGFLASGDRNAGANAVVTAPPSTSRPATSMGDGAISPSGCILGCWGGTQVDAVIAAALDGLPNIGSSAQPLGVFVRQPSAYGQAYAFGAGNGSVYRDELYIDNVLARSKDGVVYTGTTTGCGGPTTGTGVRVYAGGWVRSASPEDGMTVDVCGTARTAPVAVMPTTFAPDGVVRVQLVDLRARCLVAGAGHSASFSYDYRAVVSRWTPTGYVTVATINPGDTGDQLAGIDPATLPVGPYGPLSKWVSSWSSLTQDRVKTSTSPTDGARVEIPGIVTLDSPATRYRVNPDGSLVRDAYGNRVVDPQSTFSLAVGNLTCSAKDAR